MLTNALNIVTGIAIFGFYASVGCDPSRGGYITKNDEVLLIINSNVEYAIKPSLSFETPRAS